MKWRIASASARGSSHVRSGRPNQDACEHGTGQPGGHLKAVLAVSDGHGGSRHFRSEIGSRLAAHIAISVIQEAMPSHITAEPDVTLRDEAVPLLTQKMVENWRGAVLADFEQHPFTPEELATLETADGNDARLSVEHEPVLAYGATLLVVAAARTFMLYLQLGDGDILAVDASGRTYRPLPADDRLIGNQTTSLCQPEAWKEFRAEIARDPQDFAALVLASTDGYSNSFRSDEDFLKIGGDYLNLVRENGLDVLAEDLPTILSEASAKGSGDDITLSMMVSDAAYAASPAVVNTAAAAAEPAMLAGDPAAGPAIEAAAMGVRGEPKAPAKAAKANSKIPKPGPKVTSPEPARAHLSTAQIRLLVTFVLIVISAFAFQHYARRPKKTEVPGSVPVPAPAPSKSPQKKPAIVLPDGKGWVLKVGGSPIPLHEGTKITAKQLFGAQADKDEKGPYAEVTANDEGTLQLVNLSDDPWAVKGAKGPLENGATVALASGVKITFGHGKVATISMADEPAAN